MRASATAGLCASQHVFVDDRGAGGFIDAQRPSWREQFHPGPGTQIALLPTAALSVSYPGIKIGTAASVLDKARVEVVHTLARGRALGVGWRWAQGGQGRAENAGGQEASSKLREQLQSKLHLWPFVSSFGHTGPRSIGASMLCALNQQDPRGGRLL